MQLRKLFLGVFSLIHVFCFSQEKIKQLDKVQVDILYNYYEQDGDNGAVTGGKGSERLDNSAPQISVSIPLSKIVTFGATVGLDHYTSASTSNIDKYGSSVGNVKTKEYGTVTSASIANYYKDIVKNTTSASGKADDFYDDYLKFYKNYYKDYYKRLEEAKVKNKEETITSASSAGEAKNLASEDTRKFFSLNLNRKIPEKNSSFSLSYGYSKEYDVTSNYGKFTWQKTSKDRNKFLIINAGIYIDKWSLIYPGEIRAGRNTGAIKKTKDKDDDDHHDHDHDDDDDDHDHDDDDDDDDDDHDNDFWDWDWWDDDHDDDDDDDDDDDHHHGHDDDDDDDDDDDHHGRRLEKRDSDDDDDDDDNHHNDYEIIKNTKKTYDTDMRYTYNFGITYGGNINERLNASVSGEIIIQKGILNTPFHRVYFNDGIKEEENKLVKVEKLPRSRVKKAIGLRTNYYMTKHLITRFSYRYYFDDFGVSGHTFELETPIKIGKGLTVYPFYRLHTQSASEYFQDYGEHDLESEFYTSDYDLSKLSTNKYGIGLQYSPSNGLIDFKINSKRKFQWKTMEVRFANYRRNTGLSASSVTLGTTFTF